MENAAVLTLAGLCLGIALTGLLAVLTGHERVRERICLSLVYASFVGLIALPLARGLGPEIEVFYMPLVLVFLLVLPPAFYHFIIAKTAATTPVQVPWRDFVLPAMGGIVCIGFWTLSAETKRMMIILGDLPAGTWPSVLALITFVLIFCWVGASFAYLLAILRRLTTHRTQLRQLYSDVEKRDLRWVELVMVLLVLMWIAGAASITAENLSLDTLFAQEVLLGLAACCLLSLNLFAPVASRYASPIQTDETPDLKYARSALSDAHAAKLALRIETAMRKDALYLDPNLSLQRLSQHVGALPNLVSQTLNQEIGWTFFDYVARWRVEASKPQILAAEASVLTVALDVGFNSRSTFYKAFKRETGMTPQEFRLSGSEKP